MGPQICVDYGSVNNFVSDGTNTIPRTYTRCSGSICPTIPSPCNEAHRRFSWTPTPGTEGQTYKVCAIAKDSKPECGTSHTRRPDSCPWTTTLQFKDTCVIPSTVGASKRSTLTGFYGSEHCVNIFVTAPNPRWDAGTVATEAGVNKLAHVGCDIVWKMSATDLNNYTMRLEVDEDTPLPDGAEMVTLRSGVTVAKEFRWTPKRGMEGSFYTVCWRAWSEISYPTQMSGESKYARVRNTDGSRELPKRCVNIKVRRCKYCVQGQDTLLVKMKEYSVDMNWLRLWAANGNDDGDELTTAVEDPGLLGTGTHCLTLLPTLSCTLCLAANPRPLFCCISHARMLTEVVNVIRDAGWGAKRTAAQHRAHLQISSGRYNDGHRWQIPHNHQEPPRSKPRYSQPRNSATWTRSVSSAMHLLSHLGYRTYKCTVPCSSATWQRGYDINGYLLNKSYA